MIVPKLKKKVSAFLLGEDGKMSKQNFLTIGALMSGVALSSILLSKDVSSIYLHDNSLAINFNPITKSASAGHEHHVSHASHGSHSSHGSHASHGSHGQW